MSATWRSVAIPGADLDADEPMGSKDKAWISLPSDESEQGQCHWLLKFARLDKNDKTVSGEDWAEWLVHQFAGFLGIPTAEIRPATVDGRRAIISRRVLHNDAEQLEHGNSLLSAVNREYDTSKTRENPEYTLAAVRESLEGIAPPTELQWPSGFSAFDVFAGYLVLDAWVAGQDRHHENWAIVLGASHRRLAPSFDHGNALGFQLRDSERQRRLDDPRGLARWVENGRSGHFAGRPSLVELAVDALRMSSPGVGAYWTKKLVAVRDDDIQSVTSEVPPEIMSEPTRIFILKLLTMTRRRLLDGYARSDP